MRTTRRRTTWVGIALLATAAMLGGCGDDDDSDDNGGSSDTKTTTTESADAAPVQTIDVKTSEFMFDPKDITVDEAGLVEFNVTNDGEFPHALEIEGDGVEEETKQLNPGETDSIQVELKDGEYEIYCPVGDHKDKGMVGTVTVGSA